MKQYSDVKNAALNATPAQAAQVTPAAPAKPTGPVTWKQIYDANKDVIGANPNLIKPGQQLKMPDGSTYTVKAGDNLSKIAKNAGGGQGASVTPTASKPPTAPELTQTQQNLKNNGYAIPGTEMRSPAEIAASASLADAPATPDAGLEQSDPRHSGHAAWKAQQAQSNAADGVSQGARITPKKNFKPYPAGSRYATTESVGYNELQRIVSLVNHR
jgi:LysM repeat protein